MRKKNTKYKLRVDNSIAVKLTNVSKKYIVHHDKPTLSEAVLKGRGDEFWALKGVNFTIKKGESVGIIGPNGSGKTTLLKLITGISTPTVGKVKTYGRVVSLIDLEAGFHPDLTGVQNIFLNAAVLGMNRNEVNKKLDDIIKFADIGKFIDAPLYTYSAGMALRLGFSVAIYAEPDLLILDENISTGDQEFQVKSKKKVQEIINSGKTLVVASHNMSFISENCSRTMLFIRNKLVADGSTKKVVKFYLSGTKK